MRIGPTQEAKTSDAGMAVVVVPMIVIGASIAPKVTIGLDALGYVLLVVGALALAGRRAAPVPVLFVTTACMLVYGLRGYPGAAIAFPVMIALYTAVRTGHRGWSWVPLTALLAVLGRDLATLTGTDAKAAVQNRFLLLGWLVAASMIGEAFRQWEANVRQAEERAVEAERTREEAALRRAAEERLRIARELHDSLTHSISVIKVQAGVAVHLAHKRGEQPPAALVAIQEASTDAIRELRATLEVLRHDESAASGLDLLPDLLERARSAGLPATLTVTGEPRALPVDVDRAAYRIVQEALTNVSRHAGPAAALIELDYGADALTVRVDDDGAGCDGDSPVPGIGLLGMRERVTALGGRLRAEPRPEGGFTVCAELPAPAGLPAVAPEPA
ncbi:MAG: sensor histidine kinase [Mycobacteriales bacterium]